jgi:transaldolase/glucose-6-phosphate isomerase
LQITAEDAEDIEIPGQRCSFGTLKLAPSLRDMEVLGERGRRVLRVHLGSGEARGLELLQELIENALAEVWRRGGMVVKTHCVSAVENPRPRG